MASCAACIVGNVLPVPDYGTIEIRKEEIGSRVIVRAICHVRVRICWPRLTSHLRTPVYIRPRPLKCSARIAIDKAVLRDFGIGDCAPDLQISVHDDRSVFW